MRKKYGNLTALLLTEIGKATGFFEWPPEGTETWRHLQMSRQRPQTGYQRVYHLAKRGLITKRSANGKQFLSLTGKGELELLINKMRRSGKPASSWDGKWRIMMFDIPEEAKIKRDWLRRLLKQNDFLQLQASVYISPYPLNRAAIDYLEMTGLIRYIMIIRADDIGNDQKLKKRFKL